MGRNIKGLGFKCSGASMDKRAKAAGMDFWTSFICCLTFCRSLSKDHKSADTTVNMGGGEYSLFLPCFLDSFSWAAVSHIHRLLRRLGSKQDVMLRPALMLAGRQWRSGRIKLTVQKGEGRTYLQ